MAASHHDEFEEWLCNKLKALNTDQDVYSSYIKSILEDDESDDDKLEALEGVLVEVESESALTLCKEILDKWNKKFADRNTDAPIKQDLDACLVSIMHKQAQSTVIQRNLTEEERQYREAILAQYSHVSDNEEGDTGDPLPKAATSTATPASANSKLVVRNTNAEDVIKQEKEKRDKAKADVEKKKALDKANREKQKQQQQERKEKEKKRTQKGERKR